jgi:hypothetical protein
MLDKQYKIPTPNLLATGPVEEQQHLAPYNIPVCSTIAPLHLLYMCVCPGNLLYWRGMGSRSRPWTK